MTSDTRPGVIVVGGGLAGLSAVKALKHAPVRVLLIDRHNHHLFQPLLYQVATALTGVVGVGIFGWGPRFATDPRSTEVTGIPLF